MPETCKQYGNIRLWFGDCMDLMAGKPENHWDLVITDPEQGKNEDGGINRSGYVTQGNGSKLFVNGNKYTKKYWDTEPAGADYFDRLLAVSKNHIIWGVNNFSYQFGRGRIVWDKVNDGSDQSDCEIAYQSFNDRIDLVRYMWRGMMQGKSISEGHIQQGNKKLNEKRFHPTQKPVLLYRWMLRKYAKPGDTILDTHGGSMSLAVACHIERFELDIIEIDEDYYSRDVERFEEHISQGVLF